MNILDYFRLRDKSPKAKADFITEFYGKTKARRIHKVMADPLVLDFLHLTYLNLGSHEEVERFLGELEKVTMHLKDLEAPVLKKD